MMCSEAARCSCRNGRWYLQQPGTYAGHSRWTQMQQPGTYAEHSRGPGEAVVAAANCRGEGAPRVPVEAGSKVSVFSRAIKMGSKHRAACSSAEQWRWEQKANCSAEPQFKSPSKLEDGRVMWSHCLVSSMWRKKQDKKITNNEATNKYLTLIL